MVDIPFTELNSALPGADPLIDAANTARGFFCDVYKQYPRGIIPSLTTPAGQVADSFLRRVCEPTGNVPPDAPVPPPGGQCPGRAYNVAITYQSVEFPQTSTVLQANGPIGPAVETTVQDGSFTRFTVTFSSGSGTKTIIQGATKPGFGRIDSITPVDGLPDNCGNGTPDYPNIQPPSGSFNGTREIPVGGNNITVPVAIVPVVFAPVNIFKPEINITAGPFNFNFNAGGVNITPTFSPTTNIYLPGATPGPVNPPALPPSGDGNNEGIDLSELNAKLNELLICDRCEPSFTVQQTAYSAANSRIINLPPNTVRVDLDVTSLGAGIDAQYGGDAPTVYLVGWYSFGTAGGNSDRRHISYVENTFYPPEQANRFSYTLKGDSLGTLLVVHLVES